MRVLLQRVTRASVTIDGEIVGAIGQGLLLLVGVAEGDGTPEIDLLAGKIVNMRIFEDADDRMNRSLLDLIASTPDDRSVVGALVVSQFTLYADMRKGRRPSFTKAAAPATAEPLVAQFAARLMELGVPVQQGRFGAEMAVELINDGPVTIWLDSDDLQRPRNG
ncbi:MAG: D-aminoacyl-tRNA deacylase [Thermomicrobiales bacterium]